MSKELTKGWLLIAAIGNIRQEKGSTTAYVWGRDVPASLKNEESEQVREWRVAALTSMEAKLTDILIQSNLDVD